MFLEEISKFTGLPLSDTFSDYVISNIAGKAVYVENYIKLLSYSTNSVALKVKNNEVIVEGHNIKIASLNAKDILLKGVINKVYLAKEIKENEKEIF